MRMKCHELLECHGAPVLLRYSLRRRDRTNLLRPTKHPGMCKTLWRLQFKHGRIAKDYHGLSCRLESPDSVVERGRKNASRVGKTGTRIGLADQVRHALLCMIPGWIGLVEIAGP